MKGARIPLIEGALLWVGRIYFIVGGVQMFGKHQFREQQSPPQRLHLAAYLGQTLLS